MQNIQNKTYEEKKERKRFSPEDQQKRNAPPRGADIELEASESNTQDS